MAPPKLPSTNNERSFQCTEELSMNLTELSKRVPILFKYVLLCRVLANSVGAMKTWTRGACQHLKVTINRPLAFARLRVDIFFVLFSSCDEETTDDLKVPVNEHYNSFVNLDVFFVPFSTFRTWGKTPSYYDAASEKD
ncbi:hypothetical protein Ae201684P_006890 [Aphanomyces euteiches]|nr:hypothetical protein Ae201684P_006890 [Aphanomyces euteiches]